MKKISDAELEIMMILWQAEGTVSSAYVLEKLQDKKDWKPTSVLTFLTRLAEKGYVSQEKKGKRNIYTPLVSYEAYSGQEGRHILERMYQNSVKNFVAALVDGDGLGQEELEELQQYLDEKIKG